MSETYPNRSILPYTDWGTSSSNIRKVSSDGSVSLFKSLTAASMSFSVSFMRRLISLNLTCSSAYHRQLINEVFTFWNVYTLSSSASSSDTNAASSSSVHLRSVVPFLIYIHQKLLTYRPARALAVAYLLLHAIIIKVLILVFSNERCSEMSAKLHPRWLRCTLADNCVMGGVDEDGRRRASRKRFVWGTAQQSHVRHPHFDWCCQKSHLQSSSKLLAHRDFFRPKWLFFPPETGLLNILSITYH